MSYRTKWRRHPTDHFYWERRYASKTPGVFKEGITIRNVRLFNKSLEALYARREVAKDLDIHGGDLNRYGDPGPSWQIHDELFFKQGYEVPLPQFLQNCCRANCFVSQSVRFLSKIVSQSLRWPATRLLRTIGSGLLTRQLWHLSIRSGSLSMADVS